MRSSIPHSAFRIEYPGITRELLSRVGVRLARSAGGGDRFTDCQAIWDTGATGSVITAALAQRMNLVPTGKTTIHGVNSTSEVDTYFVDISLPNRLFVPDILVSQGSFFGDKIDVLIGMNIIQLGDLAIANGMGRTFFSFAIPPFANPTDLLEKASKVNQKIKKSFFPGR